MALLRKKYRNGQPRSGKATGSKAARRRKGSKSYRAISASFQSAGGYPQRAKRKETRTRFQLPEWVRLERLLARSRDGGADMGPHTTAFFNGLVDDHPRLVTAMLDRANELTVALS